ncbi:hypothetical protein FE697_008625 [Mumia zhuanghuii]|uniref:UPF0225 protein ACFPYK_08060 n=2 Tax=Mumia TaxID=1546255 RepID=A0ABW1QLT1_9ACTN|nr:MULTISPECIES: YchJ family metal-binding protein [Mumia]KAA1423640.1 hypothetical protein FE697_008625 [Mumia zhuanghuii]
MSAFAHPCPCGSATSYDACCGRLHRQEAQAATPEELMRSRYAAYAVGDLDHVFRTWHPRTRPHDVAPDAGITWERLEIVAASDDEVEFRAHYRTAEGAGVMHERSRFEQRAGRWFYVDGDVRDA